MLGSVLAPKPSCTRAFGSSEPEVSIPLGLWYLKLLPIK